MPAKRDTALLKIFDIFSKEINSTPLNLKRSGTFS